MGGGRIVDWDSYCLSRYTSGDRISGYTYSAQGLGTITGDNPFRHPDGYNNQSRLIRLNEDTGSGVLYSTANRNVSNWYWELPYPVNLKSGFVRNNFTQGTLSLVGYIEIKGRDCVTGQHYTLLPQFAINTAVGSITDFSMSAEYSELWIDKIQLTIYPSTHAGEYMSLYCNFVGRRYAFWTVDGLHKTFGNQTKPY